MVFLSPSDWRAKVLAEPLDELVQTHVFGGDVFAFQGHPAALQQVRSHFVRSLHVGEPENVVVVGSAKTGLSLSPDSFLRAFSAESDVDVVIVDERLFDDCWSAIRRWRWQRPNKLPPDEKHWARRREEDVFFGWLEVGDLWDPRLSAKNILTPVRDLAGKWFDAFQSASSISALSGRDVQGRLYRTWQQALEYHVSGLRTARQQMKSAQ
jgi:hypothetical protein